jgi:hypothetical protein
VDPDQVYWIRVYFKIEGVELLVQKESGSPRFGAKVVPSLQRSDLSFMNSLDLFVEQSAQISYRISTSNVVKSSVPVKASILSVIISSVVLLIVLSPTREPATGRCLRTRA